PAQLLRFCVGVGTGATDHIRQVLRCGCITSRAGMLTIRGVEALSGVQWHQEGGISVAVLRGPLNGLGTAGARHPERRVGFLDWANATGHHPEAVVLGLPTKWSWPGPRRSQR